MTSTLVALLAYPFAFVLLPAYVRQKATHYADSFFDAVRACGEEEGRRQQGGGRTP
ncbi:MAG: hypothetical protein HN742_12275 [Lentisphaerae bacterium]|jgi:hypothetical protein|nr:hypothetical protein [Lentisphaerota bacterium]MBT4823172.1 hypothetical protein [Lentisphaerota bacterium]MBT5607230.1 hypothetical protein [Lentisphaerota bacterium]MBT7054255.1 hypothetical protein [Lentisphaerota bacterium]MBT7842644.1 hypothetical protein [Lentisphaerota bacterium]